MPRLLQLEWMKLRHYRTFWILLLTFGGLLAFLYIGVSTGMISLQLGPLHLMSKAMSFSGLWSDLCFYASYFVIIISILMAILVTNEYQYRTNRQNIIDGWTRLQFYHAKWQVLIALSLLVTVFTLVLGLVSGLISGLPPLTAGEGLSRIFWVFLSCADYLGFALLLSLLLRRSGLAIGLLMAYSMIFESMLHSILLYRYQMPRADFFLPLQCSDELLPMSASKLAAAAMHLSRPAEWQYALATCSWILVFYLAGRWRSQKGDW